MHNYRELIVWKKSRVLAKSVYTLTEHFPKSELFGLTSQMRRSAVSIPSNIAEGAGRGTESEFCRFLDIANGSVCELETQLYLAFDFGFIKDDILQKILFLIEETQKMLHSLKKSFTK